MSSRDQQHPQQHHPPPAVSQRLALKRRRRETEHSELIVDEAMLQPEDIVESPVASPADPQTGYPAPSPAYPCLLQSLTPSTTSSTATSSQPQISHSLLHQAISQGDLSLLDSLLQTLASSSLTGLRSFINGFNSDGQTLLT